MNSNAYGVYIPQSIQTITLNSSGTGYYTGPSGISISGTNYSGAAGPGASGTGPYYNTNIYNGYIPIPCQISAEEFDDDF